MPDDAAVLDVPVDTGGISDGAVSSEVRSDANAGGSGEIPGDRSDSGVHDSTAPSDEDVQAAAEAAAQSGQPQGKPLVGKGGILRPDAKAALDELKVKNPDLASAIKRALYRESDLNKELPNGIKEVREIRQTIEQFGGVDGIKERVETARAADELDQHYYAGDPKFLDGMTNTDEGKAAFLRVAPMAIDRFAQMNPEGFGAYFSSVFQNSINELGLGNSLSMVEYLTRGNQEIQQYFAPIKQFFDGVKENAKKPIISQKAPGAQPADQREQSLKQKEQELTAREWQSVRESAKNEAYRSEFERMTAGRKVSADAKGEIEEFFNIKIGQMLKGRAGEVKGAVDRYFAAGDRDGYNKYFQSLYKQVIPEAMRYAVAKVMPGKPGPQANGTPAVPAKAAPKATDGYEMIASKPDVNEIDHQRRTREMWVKNQAVLKDGRKVQWP